MNKFEKQLEKWNGGVLRGAQAKLAKALKVSTATTALWATGKRHPSKGYVAQMAALFHLDDYQVLKLFHSSAPVTYAAPIPSGGEHLLRENTSAFDYPSADKTTKTPPPSNTCNLPFLSAVPTQFPHYPEEDALEWWNLPRRMTRGAKYIVRSQDIGLIKNKTENDVCFIKPTTTPAPGQTVLLHDGEKNFQIAICTVKKNKTIWTALSGDKTIPSAFRPIGIIVWRMTAY